MTVDVRTMPGAIQESDADAIIVNLFEDAEPGGATKAVDESLGGAICDLIEGGDFSGKAGQVAVLYPRGAIPARRVIVVGLGPREKFDAGPVDGVRRAAARALCIGEQVAHERRLARAQKARNHQSRNPFALAHRGSIGPVRLPCG